MKPVYLQDRLREFWNSLFFLFRTVAFSNKNQYLGLPDIQRNRQLKKPNHANLHSAYQTRP